MSQTLQAVRGMNDILPDEAEFWELFEDTIRSWLKSYGYRPIRMPIVEPTPLFKRAIGEVTDIVEKEMYSFIDSLNGEPLTLRPEGTAGCVRAVIQHNLIARQPQRLYYIGQMFRHERPQKGRYRQFHQVGVEALGYEGPDIDAEMILMGARLWADLGLDGIALQLNSLGQPEERALHRAALIAYFEENAELLDEDGKRRLHTNPLRILDTKNPAMQDLCAAAPKLIDYLGAESLAHFEGVQRVLRDAGIPFTINPRLVRGLDYYNLTVFEWVTDRLGAQGTVCAGGRYDGLVGQLGGKAAAACGFAMGIERLIALIKDAGGEPAAPAPDVYLVHQGDEASRLAFRVAEGLRDQGVNVLLHCGGGSFKSQMKKADGSGAAFAVIIGDDEAATGEAQLKSLREEGVAQQKLKIDDLADAIIGQLIDSDEEE
ncbi:histidine--tRNA ligase [Dechloromonas denitrificans]|uniref:histidine--tRNA ligase n=1 Tax=Dechloromonas denitrificans TaxID=281362 RepID=UPI001CF86C94|nr:histidine--tRNA ligase [Dechloromonas denitrificans]UCV02185.1 histidine--tRNA ligase [Dechloromonas denitrificans]